MGCWCLHVLNNTRASLEINKWIKGMVGGNNKDLVKNTGGKDRDHS